MADDLEQALKDAGLSASNAKKAAEATRKFELTERCRISGHQLGISENAERDPVFASCDVCGRSWAISEAAEPVVEPVQSTEVTPTEPASEKPAPEPALEPAPTEPTEPAPEPTPA